MLTDHEHHAFTLRAVGQRRVGLAGHAAFETFSVLTSLPVPALRSPEAVMRLLQTNFPSNHYLSPLAFEELMARFANLGIAGGSVYDAMVGAAAGESGLVLLTRDARAVFGYQALQVNIELIRQ